MKITILTPVYNDWKSASKLIEEINTIVKDLDAEFSLVIVNDASTEEKPTTISSTENLISIEICLHSIYLFNILGFWGFGVLGFWGLGFRV